MNLNLILSFILSVLISGCASTGKSNLPTPNLMEGENEIYRASATTNCDSDGCKTFDLYIFNKSNKDIKLDWNKTAFISNGQTSGGFLQKGVVIRDRNNLRPPSVIFASSKFVAHVAPNISMDFKVLGWEIKPIPAGEAGFYLVMEVDGKDVPMKMTTQVHGEIK